MIRVLGAIFVLWCAGVEASRAGYVVDGVITGSVCNSYVIISSCKIVHVDAVAGDDGKLFTVKERFDQVTEYSSGRCWIRLVSGGWLSWIWSKAAGPVFYTKLPNGEYEKIAPEYVTFACKKDD